MREIKFRAWDKVRSAMFTSPKWVEFMVKCDGSLSARNYDFDGKNQQLEVMQYTGLKDINGTEIYEGDILEFKWMYQGGEPYISDDPMRGFVKFIYGKFVIDASGTTFDVGDINQVTFERFWVVNYRMGVRADYFKMTGFSVIGNIHEHPELLDE